MRHISLETWPRREHFNTFRNWDYPHFNMCANVDLTAFCPLVKVNNISFNLAVVYVLARGANAIPEFRYRIRGENAVEHEVVHPSTTILVDEDLFTFCTLEYHENFPEFTSRATEKTAFVKDHPSLEEDQERDDLLFMTAIHWVSFTSFMHPLNFPADSVPRFAWGKFFKEGASLKMPLSVQGHHAVMDGIHVGKFFSEVQAYFQRPEAVLVAA